MTRSMTAFAQVEQNHISWEIRSVNQRYLDLSFRLPESHRHLENQFRQLVRKYLHRGKVDCALRVSTEDNQRLQIDESLLKQVTQAATLIDAATDQVSSLGALDLLKWPGMIQSNHVDQAAEGEMVLSLLEESLQQLVTMRTREGEGLSNVIHEQLSQLNGVVNTLKDEAPAIAAHQRQRLIDRISEIKVDIDQSRMEQELVYMAQKSDVQEELDRLDTHVAAVVETLSEQGAIGRRLDFLMQELNREANTLSAKASAASTSMQAVDLKVIIEQMREQIQNIE